VAEGRDIGTVVFPDASVKFFLTASDDERARRRVAELQARGQSADFERTRDEMRERDERDSTRTVAPLRAAEDAIYINSTGMTAEEVVNRMVEDVVAVAVTRD
jgi:CMP/dCMP kinase